MNLENVTPLILTFNEEANIGRALERLTWANRIVVVDSFSTDETLEIAKEHQQVEIYQRPFDDFASQCNYGLSLIDTEWVLSLDADFICTPELIDEIAALPHDPEENGYAIPYKYCIYGKPLRGSLLAPRVMLYRVDKAEYGQDGHGHRVRVEGPVGSLRGLVMHDDRKPFADFIRAQDRYAKQEAEKLTEAHSELGLVDKIRKARFVAPFAVPFYCLIVKGGILDGRAGLFYAFQRAYAELNLSLRLLERDMRDEVKTERGIARDHVGQVAEEEQTGV